jgi:hypothetical protein
MWDYDSLLGKSELYFTRAREHTSADDDVLALWLLLGLEFILRAPLARVSPMLLADPNGDSLLHAAGFPGKPGACEPKSIQAATVFSRLGRVINDFNSERIADATFLCNLRNKELHTGDAALDVDPSLWMPAFMRVTKVLCDHLSLDMENLLGADLVGQGQALVDAEDRKLLHEVQQRVGASRSFFEQLTVAEVDERRKLSLPTPIGTYGKEFVSCPACGSNTTLLIEAMRTTNERISEDSIFRDVVYVLKALKCSVCGLHLSSTAEIKSAGLAQHFVKQEEETIYERFTNSYEPDDYGND